MKESVSIEKVLNSRCSFGNGPGQNHWGVFVKDKIPPSKIVESVLRCCKKTPQFSDEELIIWFEGDCLFLGFKKTGDPFRTRLLHIESGMQQEAVYLACTAMGLGTCIQNLGINGTEYTDKIATARHIILETANSYKTEKFSIACPGPEKPFRKGKHLSVPKRDSNVECLRELEELATSESRGAEADETDISQLLWAARGRTPHYVKCHPWGLTIPTWGGGQNYTGVYLLKQDKLFRYINWTTGFFRLWWTIGAPTHDIGLPKKVKSLFQLDEANTGIILCRNEKTNRALWEIGYMLENIFLQAKSLEISYKSKVFIGDEVSTLEKSGISEAVAAVLL